MERELRRNQNALYIIGMGVVGFGLWSVIKTGILMIVMRSRFREFIISVIEYDATESYQEIMEIAKYVIIGLYVLIAVIVLIVVLLRFYVGLSAMREAMGSKKKNNAYLVIAVLMIAANVLISFSSAGEIIDYISLDEAIEEAQSEEDANLAELREKFPELQNSIVDLLVSFIVELTNLITFIQLVIAAYKSRKIKRKLLENAA